MSYPLRRMILTLALVAGLAALIAAYAASPADAQQAALAVTASAAPAGSTDEAAAADAEAAMPLSGDPTPIPMAMPAASAAMAAATEAAGVPSAAPSAVPTAAPAATAAPTPFATAIPTATPTPKPTPKPTPRPSTAPTAVPTAVPTASPTPAPLNPATMTAAQWRDELFRLTNAERVQAGQAALKMGSTALLAAADIRAHEIVTSFLHTRPNGSPWSSVLNEQGVTFATAGENIQYATAKYFTPQQIMDKWMASDGHRTNILNPNFTHLAIGYTRANGYDWYVQIFIKPR